MEKSQKISEHIAHGITQNVEDMLQSHTARTMLANSELIIMLNQASTDRVELAKLLNISDLQMSYITNVNAGEGLIKIGSSLIPFVNKFPKNTELYKLMTTKPRRRSSCLMKRIIYILCIMLLISLMLISSYRIYKELKQTKEQENTFEELIEIVEQNNTKNEQEETNINLQQLYTINNDIVGWLKIENTNINYPIMQSIDRPNYYLQKDFYKKYSSYGTPYISEQCNINISDNLIIYGHHMENKKMFGALEDYKIKDFYEEHKIIDFITLEEKEKYEIFAVFKTVAYNQNGFKYYEYINFNNENEFNTFINKCKELSFYETNVKPKYEDKLITLSTCEYSNKNGRLVVMAREINN